MAEVITVLESIEAGCAAEDGLEWFKWLYLRVTRDVAVTVPSVSDPP